MAKHTVNSKSFSLCGGVNTFAAADRIDDSCMSQAENIVFEDGKATTRKGLAPIEDVFLGNYDALGRLRKALTVTKTKYSYSGVTGYLAYDIWSDNYSFALICVYLFGNDGSIIRLGIIRINRVDGTFYNPKSIIFFTGTALHGSGLYAFVCCSPGTETFDSGIFDIYEFLSSYTGFVHVHERELYIPVIYTNGRGNRFNEARREGWVYEETPQYPEDINLLTGEFNAFFTSDGFSSGFKLPIWQLDNTMPCSCRIYENANQYTDWFLTPSGFSSTETYKGVQVTAHLDCSTGYINFTSPSGEYSIPKSTSLNGNNVMITAYKHLPDSRKAIISSSGALMFEDKIYLYGNNFCKNEVYCSSSDNPLYFPESMKTTIGNFNEMITAVHSQGRNLIAFNKRGVFRISANEQTNKNELVLPVDVGRNYQTLDRLKSSELSQAVGCAAPDTVCSCGNKTVFLATDKKVYCISETGSIFEISTPVDPLLSEISESEVASAFAFTSGHKYILFAGNRAFLLDFESSGFGLPPKYSGSKESDGVRWYYLTFPDTQRYSSGIEADGEPFVVCATDNLKVSYICKFSGEKDLVPDKTNLSGEPAKHSIPFRLKTKAYDLGSPGVKKGIGSVELFVSGYGRYTVKINGDIHGCVHNISVKNESVVKILPFIMPTCKVDAEVSGIAPFSLTRLAFEYDKKG